MTAVRDHSLSWRSLARAAQVRPWRVVLSVAAGTAALGSAVGLAAVAAWLIARAAGMPSPADLAVAAVAVRTLGIGRGLFRYVERLASHHTALGATVALRAHTYDAVARSGARHALSLRRGDVVARMGGDIDAMGDVVVRAVVPLGVAVSVSTLAAVISLMVLPAAGIALLACLAVSGLGAAALSWRSSQRAAQAGAAAHARVAVAALAAMESGTEHRVWGTTALAASELKHANADFGHAADLAARPMALASALNVAASAVALFAGVAWGVSAAQSGDIGPTSAAIVALLPLAAFEAVGAVPGAVEQLFRARVAAGRVTALAGGSWDAALRDGPVLAPAPLQPTKTPTLTLRDLSAAWPAMTPTRAVTATVPPGGALGIVGRSGIGKSTLLLTIAGALAPHAGQVAVDGRAVTEADAGCVFALTPEDAHLFGTTIVENLRVAAGDVDREHARAALEAVGLGPWLEALPQGLDTVVGSGGGTVSGGERRRLLLARALLSPAPIHLIDEPAEHLDADGVDALRGAVHAMRARGHSVVIVTHDLAILDAVDQVVSLDD